ncbi:MAG TPA: hypothetical protein VGM83_19720 [Devosiaceae bacterium]
MLGVDGVTDGAGVMGVVVVSVGAGVETDGLVFTLPEGVDPELAEKTR